MYEIVNYYLASHTAIEQLNRSLPSKAAELMGDLKESRQAVVLEETKEIITGIRQLNLLRFDQDRTADTSTLSSSYF